MSVGTGSSYNGGQRSGTKRSPNTQIAEGRPEWKVVGKVVVWYGMVWYGKVVGKVGLGEGGLGSRANLGPSSG